MADGATPALSSALRRKRKVDLVVGLDFGTSSTKAAYRELGSASRSVVPLLFDHGLTTYPEYCLPSVGCVTAERRLIWGHEAVRRLAAAPWSSGIRRLKVLVAGECDRAYRDDRAYDAYVAHLESRGLTPERCSPPHLCAVALAKQMYIVRGHLSEAYRGAELDLRFNICVPIDHLENQVMLGVYHRIHHVAEQLYSDWMSDGWDDTDLLEVAASKYETASAEYRQDGRVFIVPEAMAEIASYLVSLEADPGIHAVIDVGAGTTDLSIFNLVGDDFADRVCYWYSARNVPKGTGYVEAGVAEVLGEDKAGSGVVTEADLLMHVKAATPESLVGKRVVEGLMAIWRSLHPGWAEAYREHMKKSGEWDGIPVFLCGGGANLVGARDVFSKAWARPTLRDFAVRTLPEPNEYVSRQAPFDRLSVAYGLTFLGPEFGQFTLPADSPDHTPEIKMKELPLPWTDGEPG